MAARSFFRGGRDARENKENKGNKEKVTIEEVEVTREEEPVINTSANVPASTDNNELQKKMQKQKIELEKEMQKQKDDMQNIMQKQKDDMQNEMQIEMQKQKSEMEREMQAQQNEMQKQFDALQAEIKQAREKLAVAESQVGLLQEKLEEYRGKELQIAEVMINAQISAQRIETQARVEAELLQQQVDEELRRKNQELELMRMKVQHFRKDMNERFEQYKSSLDRIFEPGDEGAFTPTLVSVDKKNDQLG